MPFGVSNEDLELARKIATKVIKTYGDFDLYTQKQFEEHGIWNDHVSVQTAIETMKEMRKAKP